MLSTIPKTLPASSPYISIDMLIPSFNIKVTIFPPIPFPLDDDNCDVPAKFFVQSSAQQPAESIQIFNTRLYGNI